MAEGYRQAIGVGIVGAVVATGESLVANDVTAEPRRILAFPEEKNSQAELCVPIKIGGRVMGGLDLQSRQKDAFDDDDLTAMQILAD